jgi:hypothetical protein
MLVLFVILMNYTGTWLIQNELYVPFFSVSKFYEQC